MTQQMPEHASSEQERWHNPASSAHVKLPTPSHRDQTDPRSSVRGLTAVPLTQRQVCDVVAIARQALAQGTVPALTAPNSIREQAVINQADPHRPAVTYRCTGDDGQPMHGPTARPTRLTILPTRTHPVQLTPKKPRHRDRESLYRLRSPAARLGGDRPRRLPRGAEPLAGFGPAAWSLEAAPIQLDYRGPSAASRHEHLYNVIPSTRRPSHLACRTRVIPPTLECWYSRRATAQAGGDSERTVLAGSLI